MFEFDLLPILQAMAGGPVDEFVEQSGVSFLRVLRLTAFVAQVLKEVFDEGLHALRTPTTGCRVSDVPQATLPVQLKLPSLWCDPQRA